MGRWLPTFLIIDGPIGRFICHKSSPLYAYIDDRFPLLAAARAFIGEKLFLQVRNGFAHWGFDWEVLNDDSYVVIYNWEHDLPIARLHQREADAFHIAAFALIEIVDEVLVAQRPSEGVLEPLLSLDSGGLQIAKRDLPLWHGASDMT